MSNFSTTIMKFGLKSGDISPRVAALIRYKSQLDQQIKSERESGAFYESAWPEFLRRFGLTAEDMAREPIRDLAKGVMDSEFFLRGSGR